MCAAAAISRKAALSHDDTLIRTMSGSEYHVHVHVHIAQVWRGSGVFVRVRAPLVSMCKMCAVVDMIEALHRRDPLVLDDVTALLRATDAVWRVRHRFAGSSTAEALAYHCLLKNPCMRTQVWAERPPAGFPALMARWLAHIQALTPPDAVAAFRSLTSPTDKMPFSSGERFGIYWVYSYCGAGHVNDDDEDDSSQAGLDMLVAVLACTLGRKTVVFAANPNDNGLIHQELVDYEYTVEPADVPPSHSARACWDAVQHAPAPPAPPSPPPSLPEASPPPSLPEASPPPSSPEASAAAAEMNATWDTMAEDDVTNGRLQLWQKAMALGKFTASRDGRPCHAVFGRGDRSRPFGSMACENGRDACYLWCACTNGKLCRGHDIASASLRSVPVMPEELRCPTKRAMRDALKKGLTWPLKLVGIDIKLVGNSSWLITGMDGGPRRKRESGPRSGRRQRPASRRSRGAGVRPWTTSTALAAVAGLCMVAWAGFLCCRLLSD